MTLVIARVTRQILTYEVTVYGAFDKIKISKSVKQQKLEILLS